MILPGGRVCYTLGRMAKFAHQRAESFYQSRGFSEKRGGVVTPWNWNTLLFVCRDVHFYATQQKLCSKSQRPLLHYKNCVKNDDGRSGAILAGIS